MNDKSTGRLLLAICLAFLLANLALDAERASAGTVPFIFDDNRIFAEVAFVRPDGTLRHALAFVDLGTPVPMIGVGLREELGVDRNEALVLRIGRMDIRLDSSAVATDTESSFTGRNGKATVPVEAILPGSVMKNYQVVFDYARRTLTLARPGTLVHRGRRRAVPSEREDGADLSRGGNRGTAVRAGRGFGVCLLMGARQRRPPVGDGPSCVEAWSGSGRRGQHADPARRAGSERHDSAGSGDQARFPAPGANWSP